jgi:ketosteroid isomerase-like protein
MKVWTEDFENWSTNYERLVDLHDDRVMVLAHQWATGKGSGVPVELHFGQIWEFRDGKVIRIRNYIDENSALEAAGLRE